MKITMLMLRLEEILKSHGDLEIFVDEPGPSASYPLTVIDLVEIKKHIPNPNAAGDILVATGKFELHLG